MSTPWSICVAAESPLTLIMGVKQKFWIVLDESDPIEVGPGDIAIVRPNTRFLVTDSLGRTPDITVFRGQDCRDGLGNSVSEQMTHGVRSWGNDASGDTVFAVAAYENLSETSDRLCAVLPPALAIADAEWRSPLVGLLCDEMARDESGQAAVLDRLVDLLLTAALKAWFNRAEAEASPDWRSDGDPIVARALQLIYAEPARAWTIESLSTQSHVSRATLARRFHDIVGEPPITFLTNHRMALAADLLRCGGQTVAGVAEQVGYQNPFAFSVAFKRNRGVSPKDFRLAGHKD